MKKLLLPLFSFVIFAFAACEFNQSVNTDLITGAYSRGDGIGCDEIYIIVNDTIKNTNEFGQGDELAIGFGDVVGLKKDDNGNVFPGLSLVLIDGKTDTLLEEKDLLASIDEEGTNLSPLELSASIALHIPVKTEKDYHVHIKIWDKKGEGTFVYELPFSVAPRIPDFNPLQEAFDALKEFEATEAIDSIQ